MTNAYNPGSQFRPRSPYGWRIDPVHDDKEEFHAGQDFAAPAGTPIPAAGSGTVVYSGLNKGFGNVVIIKNDAGGYSLYGHMQGANQPGPGQRIWQGDTIGLVGNTGKSTGYHPHYSVITKDAGDNIKSTNRDGSIGISLDDTNTINPAGYNNYDPTPRYLDETRRAAQIMSGAGASTTSGDLPPDHQDSFGDRLPKVGLFPGRHRTANRTRPFEYVHQPLRQLGLRPAARFRRSPFAGVALAARSQEIRGSRCFVIGFGTRSTSGHSRASAKLAAQRGCSWRSKCGGRAEARHVSAAAEPQGEFGFSWQHPTKSTPTGVAAGTRPAARNLQRRADAAMDQPAAVR